MNSRELISHPGPQNASRMVSAMGSVTRQVVHFKAGQILLESVAQLMNEAHCDSAVIVMDSVDIGPFNYVMPSYSKDKLHAAWYSDTHFCNAARIRNGTAIVGKREGNWWMHCHALWDAGHDVGLGHLLPDKVTLASDATAELYAFTAGKFDVALDAETAFPIFHVTTSNGQGHGNALIAKVNPHMDLYTAIEQLITSAGFDYARIFGIGSLIGASFNVGQSMECPISEVLVLPGARWNGSLDLPVHCVDTENQLFSGALMKNAGPVLVTFELLIVETGDFMNNPG